jgi:uncharacterized protein (TIGR02271 family)
MANTVVGIFENESDAQKAQNYLLANGFADGDVDIKTASYKSENGTSTVNDDNDDVTDRIGNFFRDLFDGDEDETERYSEAGRRGTIVTVHANDAEEAETAAGILDQFGAVDLDDDNSVGYSTADQAYTTPSSSMDDDTYVSGGPASSVNDDVYGSPSSSVDDDVYVSGGSSVNDDTYLADASSVDDERYRSDDQRTSLPVIEEELQVGKREIETGGVRLRSRIVERPVQESIRLRQESVTVNRTPVDRIASDSEFDTFIEGTIEMKEYAEIPVVSKEARVVEEVSLNKTVDEREEVINETLRSTEVDVEDLTDEERLRRTGLDL